MKMQDSGLQGKVYDRFTMVLGCVLNAQDVFPIGNGIASENLPMVPSDWFVMDLR